MVKKFKNKEAWNLWRHRISESMKKNWYYRNKQAEEELREQNSNYFKDVAGSIK